MRKALPLLLLVAAVVVLAASFPSMPPDDPRFAPSAAAGPTGQWNLLSYAPDVPPTPHASGIAADLAWQTTTGSPDVPIAILDSGVDYDHEDLRAKVWLNRGELPVPTGGCCTPPVGDAHDCNADGAFTVADYACDGRVTDSNGSGAVDRGDLRGFANEVDDDGNGYVDDLSGWDADDDDGDEFDHRFFGHGTGRAGIAAADTNNATGIAGVCPDCPLMNVRVDDTFVCASEGVAKGAIWAVDAGARVFNMSLGCLTNSRLLRGAFAYATRKNVLAVNATANEFSFHHNVPAILDDVMSIGAVTPDDRTNTTTWLQKANFANYGAHLDVVAPTDVPSTEEGRTGAEPDHAVYSSTASGTSSSTPHAAGVAGLVFARARALILSSGLPVGGLALPDISTQEVRQILNGTARDVTPADGTDYPVSAGWDRWTGYGRVDAQAAVARVAAGTIPPEADINEPGWYTLVDGEVTVRFYANARWASRFDWVLEAGAGVEPAAFAPLASASAQTSDPGLSSADLASNFTATWNTAALATGLHTLRLRVTDDLGNHGEDRMAVWVRHRDAQDRPGFPRVVDGSLESLSVALVDLDGDNRLEIVAADGDGQVHAIRDDGTDLPGFPVHTDLPRHLPVAASDAFDGDPANGEVPLSWASTIGGVAVADLDRDGVQEIVTGASDGQVYCWHADARPCAGFPVSTDHGFSRDPYPPHAQKRNASRGEGIGATPSLGDLDRDGLLEIVVGSADQKLYVWHADGTRMAPFPIQVFDPSAASGVSEFAPRAIASSAAIADLDADGWNEIVVGTNETYGPTIGGTARAYVILPDGSFAPNWPVKPVSLQTSAVPLVAEGVGTSPAVADLDGDGRREVGIAPFFGTATVYEANGDERVAMQATFGATGAGSDADETTPEGGPARGSDAPGFFYTGQGAFADLDADGRLDYLAPSIGSGIVGFIGGSGGRLTFDHLLSAWDATTGARKPGFPRVMEDWQFFTGPAVADVDGDGRPEAVATSGGFFVHAFQADGNETAGWPKLTGQWATSTPSIGDLDGDGTVEVVQTTRLGTILVWNTAGAACQRDEWRKFRHDEWNTGTWGADTRRPGRVLDLAFRRRRGRLSLSWTAPGDDGACGTASRYELRSAATPIDEETFAAAPELAQVTPAAGGTAETLRLRPRNDRPLFYAIRAFDEAGNASPLAVVSALEVKRLRIGRARAGRSTLELRATLPVAVRSLGLPADVQVRLAVAGETVLDATVPAAALRSKRRGRVLTFRDPGGTVAGGIGKLVIAGGKATMIRLRTRPLSVPVPAAAFSLRLGLGALDLPAAGTLRPRRGGLTSR